MGAKQMKVEINITDEIEDTIILESLKWHLGVQKSYKPTFQEAIDENKETIAAFKLIVDYYGG